MSTPTSTPNGAQPHPGAVMTERFLAPRGLSIHRLAVAINVPSSTLERFRSGRTRVTDDLAQRLANYFDTDTKFWHDHQARYDSRLAA
ncbi:HigA family addiction module antidote protein [Corynebacterium sp. TAE3-ERU12]|uniref:HigA family addiction module antitoxin n=1 Tax=Corynebacterium sp. TAE3-ERU12 TaxID=2849491 RepID=UPI001C497C2F|nr:HigA family addiction module antitoxin [Corynebacterium sp. TAE3-ERU12]MBV7296191.1 HigA family addiction module antidote protein [Corynebacterium sp. TAE3-ERU12]